MYRGSQYPDLVGKYFFADYCAGQIGIMAPDNTYTWITPTMGGSFTTFGINHQNELFIGGRSNGGVIYRIKSSNLSTLEIEQNKIRISSS